MDKVIKIERFIKKFGSFVVVNNILFEVLKGCIFGLFGFNGFGKIIIIKIICGVLRVIEGYVEVFGKDVLKYFEEVR